MSNRIKSNIKYTMNSRRRSWNSFSTTLLVLGLMIIAMAIFLFFCQKEKTEYVPFIIMGLVGVALSVVGVLVYRWDRRSTCRLKKVDRKKDYRITLVYNGKAERDPDLKRMAEVIDDHYKTRGFYMLLCYPDMGDVSEVRGFFNHMTDKFETNAFVVSEKGPELWFGYTDPERNTDMLMCQAIINKEPMDFGFVAPKTIKMQLSEMKSAIDLLHEKYTITDSAIAIIKDGAFFNNKMAIGGRDDYIAILRDRVKKAPVNYYDSKGRKQVLLPENVEEFIKDHLMPKPVEV